MAILAMAGREGACHSNGWRHWRAGALGPPDDAKRTITGRLEPAGAQVHAESHQAERNNQPDTAKQRDDFARMIVGMRFGNCRHRNDRNRSHRNPPFVSPEMLRAWRL